MSRKKPALLFLFTFILLFSLTAEAQMFSVDSKDVSTRRPTNSFFRIGYVPATFSFTGNPNQVLQADRFDFSDGAVYVGIESPGLTLRALVGNNLTGMTDNSLFNLAFILSNNLTLIRKSRIQFGLPVEINTMLTTVAKDETEIRYSQSDIGIGSGFFLNTRPAKKFIFNNEFTAGYGFSNSSGNFFGGSVWFMNAKSRLNIGSILGGRSLSVGYDFHFRSFDIDDQVYDYDLTTHELTIGISF